MLPNIVLIVLDTLRAQNCSIYGYRRKTTPVLDRLAREGIIFANAITPAPWTLPAHASLFTGKFCFQHKADGRKYVLDNDLKLVSEILRDEGYSTGGISSNVWISDAFGFHRGFDYFYKTWQLIQAESSSAAIAKKMSDGVKKSRSKLLSYLRLGRADVLLNVLYGKFIANRSDNGSAQVTEKAIRWLDSKISRPFFLFLNYMDPHAPYLAPSSHRLKFSENLSNAESRRLAKLSLKSKKYHMGKLNISKEEFKQMCALYDSEILYTDSQVGKIIDFLKEKDELENTVIIAVGDHGENIGDHNLMAHRFSLHQTLLHVPLVMRFPKLITPGTTEATYVQLTDILPTLLSVIGRSDIASDRHLIGNNILDLPLKKRPALAEYLSIDYVPEVKSTEFDFERSSYNRTLRAFYDGDYKLIESQVDNMHELYNLKRDSLEQRNLAKEQPEMIKNMREAMSEFVSQITPIEKNEGHQELDVDEIIESRLKSLGYLE